MIPSIRLCGRSVVFLSVLSTLSLFGQTSVVVSDTFTRANSSALGVADSGQTWTAHYGSASIENGAARLGSSFVLATLDSGKSKGDAEVKLIEPANEFWLIVRFINDANYWRFGRWQGGAYQLQQITGNALGAPQIQPGATVQPAAGDVLRCVLNSPGLTCSVNGSVIATTTDAFGATATRIGLSGYLAANARFDNLNMTASDPPDLSVRLDGPAFIYAGSSISWTATVQNIGTGTAQSAELRMQPPASHPNLTLQGAACTPDGSAYRCPVGTLGPQATTTVTATLFSTAGASSALTLTATAPAVAGETDTSQNAASLTTHIRTPIPADALVVHTFTHPNGTVLAQTNTAHQWTHHAEAFTVQNGYAAPGSGFSLSTLDTGTSTNETSFLVVQPAQEFWLITRFENTSNYWRFGRWQNQGYQLQQVSGGSLANPSITSLATVQATAGDTISCNVTPALLECAVNRVPIVRTSATGGNNATRIGISSYLSAAARFEDLVVTGPPPPPDLGVTLSGPVILNTATAGTWTATVRNHAAAPAPAVEMVLTPPPGLTQISVSGPSCTPVGSDWKCLIGTMTPGQTATVQLNGVTPAVGGRIHTTASIAVRSGESNTANNQASFPTNVRNPEGGDNTQLYDSFDRPNSPSLGVATTGQTWVTHAGAFSIVGGQASSGQSFSLVSIDAAESTLDITASLLTTPLEFWLILRFQDNQNYWRFGRRDNSAYQLQQVRAGAIAAPSITTLATILPTPGDILNCTSSANGISCSVNGAAVATTTNQDGQSSTRLGLSAFGSSTAKFDDLLVLGPPPVPNPAVSVNAPNHALVGQPHPVDIVVRNAGRAPSGSGSLQVTLPASLSVTTPPSNCTGQGAAFTCSVPGLAPSATAQFTFSLTATGPVASTGTASISVPGDAVALDNQASWTTWAHTTGGDTVIDGFDRPDTTSGLGLSLTQQPWADLAPGFRILNGQAVAPSTGARAGVNPGFAYGTLEAVLGPNAATTGLLFRIANSNNYYRLAADENGYYALRKVINGSVQSLQFGYVREQVRPSPGDVVRLVTRPDDGVFVMVNGQQILDFGDPALMEETGWGIASVGGPASVDQFVVTNRMEGLETIDNFELPDGLELQQPTSGARYQWRPWLGSPWIHLTARARPTSSEYTYTWIDTSTEQASVSVKVPQFGSGAWAIFRVNEISNTYFRFGKTGAAYAVEFMQHGSPGTLPVTVQTLASPTPQNGDVLRVNQFPDGTVECSVNGVVTHRFVDNTTNFRWTLYGLASEGPQAAFDDFHVTLFPQ